MHADARRTTRSPLASCLLCLALACWIASLADTHAAGPAKRARPPKFTKSTSDAFFPDAREKLVGPRPDKAAGPSDRVAAPPESDHPPTSAGASSDWSKLIAADVIEDEIKSQQRNLGELVRNAAKFKAGDYRLARVALSVLATLLAIDADYGAPMRWQREAPSVRDLVARAGLNCKVGTDASYKDAKARFEDLETLVRGGSIDLPTAKSEVSWSEIADRGPLMKRLALAHDQRMAPWTANSEQFARHQDALSHEAQMVAALAAVIQRDGYEFADDETYRQYAEAMGTQAVALREAIAMKNYAQARQAVGEINKTCSSCHEGYRN